MLSVVRLLHQFVSRVEVVDDLAAASKPLMPLILRVLDCPNPYAETVGGGDGDGGAPAILPKDATFVVELLKKVFKSVGSRELPYFVQSAMESQLPIFLLDNVVGMPLSSLQHVLNPAALKIHAVDALKAMVSQSQSQYAARTCNFILRFSSLRLSKQFGL